MLWVILFIAAGIGALLSLVYLVTRFHKFGFIKRLAAKNKKLSWVIAAVPIAALIVLFLFDAYVSVIITLHLSLIWAVCDLVTFIRRKVRHCGGDRYIAGAAALIFTTVYLGAGWFFAHHVFETDYRLKTDKQLGESHIRVALFADSHIGVTLKGESFSWEIERICAQGPDIILIAGDFVDDDTKKADMIAACEALGKADVPYGVYYADGNHDKGYGTSRDFTIEELYAELEKNGVTVLRDESVLIDDRFYLIGRKDRNDAERMTVSELTAELDKDTYKIIIDHQPNDYTAESQSDADLVLSGHTHGGHIFPAGLFGLAIGANDKLYGMEEINGTAFIVTSGISGWAIPFKTGCISEYVIIDIYDR